MATVPVIVQARYETRNGTSGTVMITTDAQSGATLTAWVPATRAGLVAALGMGDSLGTLLVGAVDQLHAEYLGEV